MEFSLSSGPLSRKICSITEAGRADVGEGEQRFAAALGHGHAQLRLADRDVSGQVVGNGLEAVDVRRSRGRQPQHCQPDDHCSHNHIVTSRSSPKGHWSHISVPMARCAIDLPKRNARRRRNLSDEHQEIFLRSYYLRLHRPARLFWTFALSSSRHGSWANNIGSAATVIAGCGGPSFARSLWLPVMQTAPCGRTWREHLAPPAGPGPSMPPSAGTTPPRPSLRVAGLHRRQW